jgi:CBS domain-containing protein
VGKPVLAKDLMRGDVLTLREEDLVEQAVDALVGEHFHGAPVVDAHGTFVGVISQLDLYFGTMTRSPDADSEAGSGGGSAVRVRDVMTSPAVSATEDTTVVDLCRMMFKLRIHRIPIVRGTKVVGIVSSLDVCEAVANGVKLS